MPATLRVHLIDMPQPENLAVLESRLPPGIRLTGGQALPSPADYHILVAGRPERPHLTANAHLRAVIVPFAGLPASTRALLLEFPHIAVHNLHHNAAATAETAITLLLAAAKFTVPFDRALRANDWSPRYRKPAPAVLLEGKTVLILGYGQIGRRAARVCRAMGMRVLAVRRQAGPGEPDDIAAAVHPPADLPALLPRADAVIVALPLTDSTRGLLGAPELALLPPGAMLVNVGRGPVVDEAALYAALRRGALGAAGLDVWYNYPPDEAARASTAPAAFPFHALDNVVMSPHRGGATADSEPQRMLRLAELLSAAARDEPMPNRVDLQAGY